MPSSGKNLHGYYTIREKLGEDLFAEIWEIKPIFSALELFGFFFKKPVKAFQAEAVEQLRAYLRHSFNLNHPNLVNVFESDVFEGKPYILTERIPGFRLSDYFLARESFPLRECLSVVYEILAAVAYLHRRGIAQNLINPQTIWIAPQRPFLSRIRIACFGLQFTMGEPFLSTEEGYRAALAYLAPEIRKAWGSPVDFQSDLYSVGVILFRMLTGELPERIGGPEHQPMPVKQAEKVLKDRGVPREVRRLVLVMMKIRAARRTESADGLVEAVLAAIRRYTVQDHGEIDAVAYIGGLSDVHKKEEPRTQATWNPQAVYGKRTRETAEAEGGSQRNTYFRKLVEEYIATRVRLANEWVDPYADLQAGLAVEDKTPDDFVDEVRLNPVVHEDLPLLEPADAPEDEAGPLPPTVATTSAPQEPALVDPLASVRGFWRRLWAWLRSQWQAWSQRHS